MAFTVSVISTEHQVACVKAWSWWNLNIISLTSALTVSNQQQCFQCVAPLLNVTEDDVESSKTPVFFSYIIQNVSSSQSCVPVSNCNFLIYKVSLYICPSFILRFIQFKCCFYCEVGLEKPTVFYNWISFPLHKPVSHWQHYWAIVYSSKGCICFVIANILKLQPWV